MIDITDKSITRDQISNAWPQVGYKGNDIFKAVYETDMVDRLAPINRDGNGCNCESQECYLGYLPSNDTFVMGFDCWLYDDDGDDYEDVIDNVVYFKVSPQGKATIVDRDFYNQMFYSGGVYKQLQAKHKDLLDLRLD